MMKDIEEPNISKFTKLNSRDIIKEEKFIGKGQCGDVYRYNMGYWWWKKQYAVKLIKVSKVTETFVQHVYNMWYPWNISKKHHNLVDIECVHRDESYVYIWMEACSTNLLGLIEQLQQPNSSLIYSMFSHIICRGDPKTATLLHYIKQIAQALQALHTEYLIHRNLKHENILFAEKSLKLVDYNMFECSSLYKAPEVIIGGNYGFKSDVYALGKIFTDLLDIVDDCKKKRAVEDLTKLMKSKYPQERPSMAEVVEKLDSIEKMWSWF